MKARRAQKIRIADLLGTRYTTVRRVMLERRFPVLYRVILEKDEDGGYASWCPALPGCYSQGRTRKETISNMKKAIECHIESLSSQGKHVPLGEAAPDIELIEVKG